MQLVTYTHTHTHARTHPHPHPPTHTHTHTELETYGQTDITDKEKIKGHDVSVSVFGIVEGTTVTYHRWEGWGTERVPQWWCHTPPPDVFASSPASCCGSE